jgi:molybdopterin converting factor small subunit
VNVRIPTPLRSYTNRQARVTASGGTVSDLLDDLDQQFPGIRFRVVDEQNRLRRHMKIWVGDEPVKDLSTSLDSDDEVTIMQALSGG